MKAEYNLHSTHVDDSIKKDVVEHLERIERKEGIQIIFAIESGSRLWGFESPDSDYDIRFIYKRLPRAYISLDYTKMMIEETVPDKKYDIVGHDIHKYLRLLWKSNPNCLEWLSVPDELVYIGKTPEYLLEKREKFTDMIVLFLHYKSMGKKNYMKYIESGKQVSIKKYMYVVRCTMCCMWIQMWGVRPPIKFDSLLEGLKGFMGPGVYGSICELKKNKMKSMEGNVLGSESDPIFQQELIDKFIEEYLISLQFEKHSGDDKKTDNKWVLERYLHHIIFGDGIDE